MGEELVAWGPAEDSLLKATSGFQLKGGCRDRASEHRSRGEGEGAWHAVEMDFITWCALAPPAQPSVPEDVEPKEPDYLGDPRAGRFIIPEGIRPVLKEFRIEVRCLLLGWLPTGLPQADSTAGLCRGQGLGRESGLDLKCALRPEQMAEREVLDVREKRSQQFKIQSCWVAGLGEWPQASLGVCVLTGEGGGSTGQGFRLRGRAMPGMS